MAELGPPAQLAGSHESEDRRLPLAPGDQGEQVAAPDLGQHAGGIEVHALVDDAVAVEEEHRDGRHSECVPVGGMP